MAIKHHYLLNTENMVKSEFEQIRKDVFIVIAAYNESKSILNVISDIKKYGYHNIIIVDDGSKDDTFSIISKQKDVFVLKHIINRGQGASLKTGIDFALKMSAKIIVTFDADGQHKAEDLDSMVFPIAKGFFDISFGSRFLTKKSNVPFFKKIVLKGAIFLMYVFYGANLTDAHNGFRAMSKKSAQKINITSDGMEHASEIISEVISKKLKFVEIPVTILYTDYSIQKGQSVFNAFKILSKMIIKKILEI